MGDAPTATIVVPTFARPVMLRRCLDALTRLEATTFSFEVVVVDDGGPDALDALVAEYADLLDLRLIRQRHGGPAAARNAGVAVARGRYVGFVDDDCAPAPDWLAEIVRELGRDDRQLLGGRVENALIDNPYSTASEQITEFVYEYNRTAAAREPFFTANNMALSADVFRAMGGFTTAIPSATAEDKEFCDRLRAHGISLTHVPSAIVYHAHTLTFTAFLRQHFNYGRGILAFRLNRRHRNGGALLPEPARFYAGLVLSPLNRPARAGRWQLMALLAAAQLATLAGAVRETVTWRRPAIAPEVRLPWKPH